MRDFFSKYGVRSDFLIAILALAAAAMYGHFLWNPIVFDDNNFFGGPVHPDYLETFSFQPRWLPYATFEWTRVALGLNVIWFRLGNLALHIAVTGALFLFLRALFEAALPPRPAADSDTAARDPLSPLWLAFFGALIFALHPAAVYAVAYLIQRTTLMAMLFTLVMWYFFLKGVAKGSQWWLIASAGAYLLAVLGKEHAIMAPAVALAMLFLVRRFDRHLLKQVGLTFVLYAVIAVWIVIRVKQGGIIGLAYEPRGVEQLSILEIDPRFAYPLSILTQSFLFFKYLLIWMLPNPAWMSIDMYESFATRFWSWPHTAGLLAFVLYPIVAIWLLMKRGKQGLLGLAMLCPWLMFATELSTVRIQESFVIYRSYLWMPGVFAGLPFLFQKTPAKRTAVVLTALALVMAPATWGRLVTFTSPLLVWDDAARLIQGKDSRPGVERIYHNRGLHFSKLGFTKEALIDLNKAILLNPKHILAYNDRGATYLAAGKYLLALKDFDQAIALNPKFFRPYLGRALAYEGLNDSKAAMSNYKDLCRLGFVEGCSKLRTALPAP
jgi:hypothetical protein